MMEDEIKNLEDRGMLNATQVSLLAKKHVEREIEARTHVLSILQNKQDRRRRIFEQAALEIVGTRGLKQKFNSQKQVSEFLPEFTEETVYELNCYCQALLSAADEFAEKEIE